MGVAGPLVGVVGVFLAFLPWACLGEPGALGAPPEVPRPMNVTIESYNFNTSVRWNYINITSKPLFFVEVLCYGRNNYTEVNTCVNISQRYCDLTHTIGQCNSFWMRVKAVVGLHESEYEESKDRFSLLRNVRIGPPMLHCNLNDNKIQVEINHPLTPIRKKSARSYFTDFTYKVFLWERGSPEERHEFEPDRCTRKSCSINLTISSWNTIYCVSAAGHSRTYVVNGEESEEICIGIPLKPSLDLTGAIIGGSVGLVVLAVILVIAYKSLRKRKIRLPRSLLAVVKGVPLETKPEGKYISIITEACKPVSPEGEECKLMDPVAMSKATDLSACVKEVDADGCQGTLSEAEELSDPEGTVVEILEGEQNPEDNVNYFKSVSGQGEMSNSLPNLDLSGAEMHQPTVQGSFMKLSGYDKPHWESSDSGEELLITQSPGDSPEA